MSRIRLLLVLLVVAVSLSVSPALLAQSVVVYDETLQNSFENWSYGAVLPDFASTAQAHGGTHSIAFTGSDFNAVAFAHPSGTFSTAQYNELRFWVHGGASGGQAMRLYVQGAASVDAPLNGYITGGSIAANQWREVVVPLGSGTFNLASFDRIDLQSDVAGVQPVLYIDDVTIRAAAAPPPAGAMTIERDVTVGAMTSDRFTWSDAAGKPRVAALAHNDGQVGPTAPGGYTNHGGALREFRYQMPDNTTRIADVTTFGNAGQGGFGYVVSHRGDGGAGIAADDSPLGYAFSGTFQRVFEGRHHALFRFTQLYPRYSSTTANPPNTLYNVPVTIEWMFSTGRDNPVWSVTWDLSGVPVDALNDDSRAPYGELNIDGDGSIDVSGVAWGDRYKFLSTTAPVTLNSSWDWSAPNTVPYVKIWVSSTNATMGTVQTQTMTQQDAGAGRNPFYHDMTLNWGKTSADGPAGDGYIMPYQNEWPYQSIAFNLGPGTSSNNTRLTWGTQYGFLGQQNYTVHDNVVATAPGWPKKSYSTYIVLGPHSLDPVGQQVTEVETVQSLTLTASTGSVVTTGPAGVNRADTITYAPAGYNHVYGALAFQAAGNQLDANIAVGAGTLHHPLLIVSNYTGAFPTVRLGGVILVQDTDYYPSLRAASNELWITLNRDLTGALNHLQISTTPITSSPFALAVDSAGNGVLEEAEAVEVSPTWTNETAAAAGLTGTIALSGIPGPAYTVVDGAASYGPIPSGGHASCAADCYTLQVTGTRPVQHWDALLTETLNDGSAHGWTLHVGTSFSDVSSANTFYRFIETIYHYGVSTGCGGTSYCPSGIVLRGQMAAFIARALAGSDAAVPVSGSAHGFNYNCTSGGASAFDDVAPVDAFCRHIHYIYARNVTVGISPTTFSPGGMTSRAEMAHFIARALVQPAGDAGVPASYTDPTTGLSYDCTDSDQASNHFSDVGDAAFGCKQIHYLWARGVVSGFPDGTYRSSESIPRDAMAKFLANGFGLKLYKP